ncbi:Uncharacterized protein dnl_52360 [Desulfonema limicola]|uniref:Uncharacterized protein n=1 Tax=Desulfonema limicola TaxID=45656 RepID=A0A975BCI2_9BACT|nr:Uncharacterized protein dnl_52360 [Desulfonema limicola]
MLIFRSGLNFCIIIAVIVHNYLFLMFFLHVILSGRKYFFCFKYD